MRRLSGLFGRSRRAAEPLILTEQDVRVAPVRSPAVRHAPQSADLQALSAQIGQVADYVARLRREIAALKPGAISNDEMPSVRSELTSITAETQSATDRIMVAAEAILASDAQSLDGYRREVGAKLTEILEACSFQDIAGQRLARATTLLGEMEKRIDRFARAVNIPDAADVFDRAAIVREMRREVLLVDGPQGSGAAIDQDAVDRMFG